MIDIAGLREDKRPQSSTIVHALLDRLEAAEKERDALLDCLNEWKELAKSTKKELNAVTNNLDDHRALVSVLREEVAKLRAKIEQMERQEPVAWIRGRDEHRRRKLSFEKPAKSSPDKFHWSPLYALPGAQNIPEKLCYDSRWEISIDYVDGWNAAVDMMRGKSPSWHCPDCCIAFPFGAPKSCPNDDARCNSLLAAAPEAKT